LRDVPLMPLVPQNGAGGMCGTSGTLSGEFAQNWFQNIFSP